MATSKKWLNVVRWLLENDIARSRKQELWFNYVWWIEYDVDSVSSVFCIVGKQTWDIGMIFKCSRGRWNNYYALKVGYLFENGNRWKGNGSKYSTRKQKSVKGGWFVTCDTWAFPCLFNKIWTRPSSEIATLNQKPWYSLAQNICLRKCNDKLSSNCFPVLIVRKHSCSNKAYKRFFSSSEQSEQRYVFLNPLDELKHGWRTFWNPVKLFSCGIVLISHCWR